MYYSVYQYLFDLRLVLLELKTYIKRIDVVHYNYNSKYLFLLYINKQMVALLNQLHMLVLNYTMYPKY